MPYDDFLGQYVPRPAAAQAIPVMAPPAQASFPNEGLEFAAGWPQSANTAAAQNGNVFPGENPSLFASGPTGPEDADSAQGQHDAAGRANASPAKDTPPNFTYPVVYSTYQEMLRGIIGRYVIAEFLVGTTMLEQRVGTLTEVGPGYLVLKDPCTNAHVACDLYSLKFISILPPTSATEEALCTFQLFNKY